MDVEVKRKMLRRLQDVDALVGGVIADVGRDDLDGVEVGIDEILAHLDAIQALVEEEQR
jgi:hypothetical protein